MGKKIFVYALQFANTNMPVSLIMSHVFYFMVLIIIYVCIVLNKWIRLCHSILQKFTIWKNLG